MVGSEGGDVEQGQKGGLIFEVPRLRLVTYRVFVLFLADPTVVATNAGILHKHGSRDQNPLNLLNYR